MVRAVVFDVGENLIDETRIWTRWAERLGVPALTFLGVLGDRVGTLHALVAVAVLMVPAALTVLAVRPPRSAP